MLRTSVYLSGWLWLQNLPTLCSSDRREVSSIDMKVAGNELVGIFTISRRPVLDGPVTSTPTLVDACCLVQIRGQIGGSIVNEVPGCLKDHLMPAPSSSRTGCRRISLRDIDRCLESLVFDLRSVDCCQGLAYLCSFEDLNFRVVLN